MVLRRAAHEFVVHGLYSSILVNLDGLHHPHLLMVHHMAVEHEDTRVIEEPGAEDDAATLAFHDDGLAPQQVLLRYAIDLRHLEGVGVDAEDVIVVLVRGWWTMSAPSR